MQAPELKIPSLTLVLLLALAFIPNMNRFQITPAEEALQNLFGEEYSHYCKQVRRWL